MPVSELCLCDRGIWRPVYHDCVNLPVNPPLLPMLSKRVEELPDQGDWVFEPKWDGFRALVFRDGDEILPFRIANRQSQIVLSQEACPPSLIRGEVCASDGRSLCG